MNNPNVRFGKPAGTEFSDSDSHRDATGKRARPPRGKRRPLRSKSSPHGAGRRPGQPFQAAEIPFKKYADSVGDPVRRSMLLAQVQLETGKHPSTVDRYLYGVTRPDSQNRRAIAFVVGKFTGCTVSGDELFPAAYPYSGRQSCPQSRLALRRDESGVFSGSETTCPGSPAFQPGDSVSPPAPVFLPGDDSCLDDGSLPVDDPRLFGEPAAVAFRDAASAFCSADPRLGDNSRLGAGLCLSDESASATFRDSALGSVAPFYAETFPGAVSGEFMPVRNRFRTPASTLLHVPTR